MIDPDDTALVAELRERTVGHPALMDRAAARIEALAAELASVRAERDLLQARFDNLRAAGDGVFS